MRAAAAFISLAVLAAAVPAVAQEPAAAPDAVKVLLDQASYWLSQNQPDQAQHALDRALGDVFGSGILAGDELGAAQVRLHGRVLRQLRR